MTAPWLDDACSLVAAFRRKELSPLEALDSCIKAIERSQLNAFSHLDFDHARLAAATADIDLPFGGVPFGVKELEAVSAWPLTSASMAFRYRSATQDATSVARLRQAGAVLVAQTTASELGAVNCTSTRLHGTTRNPWDPNRTPGGSSGGSAAAVAGGLVPIATGSEGGGSIRIPAGFSGLLGLKATHGRIPMGPRAGIEPFTSVKGCLARSVRDTARYFDCCNGFDQRDPYSLPAAGGWESALGTGDLSGMRVAIIPDLNTAQLRDEVKDAVARHGERLAAAAGMRVVDVVPRLPVLRGQWAMASHVGLVADLGDAYPDCLEELSPEVRLGLEASGERFNLERAARIELYRRELNEAFADLFEAVDFVICSTNPDVAFTAEGPPPLSLPGRDLVDEIGLVRAAMNHGALTAPSNLNGSPAISIPGPLVDEMPAGLQVLAAHHTEQLLLDLALVAERELPWPKVAPGSPI